MYNIRKAYLLGCSTAQLNIITWPVVWAVVRQRRDRARRPN